MQGYLSKKYIYYLIYSTLILVIYVYRDMRVSRPYLYVSVIIYNIYYILLSIILIECENTTIQLTYQLRVEL